jgi:O-acetyl-ADP-ribose deacetylase
VACPLGGRGLSQFAILDPLSSWTGHSSALLADCHRNSLRVAAELGAKTVAFPAISTGIYRWPVESAAEVARAAVADAPVEVVRFVLFDRVAYDAYARP